CHFWVCP
uniref:A-conotoxin cyclic Mila n=1 Tax=Conus miliaris TaxID=97181 RepID=CX1A_CONML|nr:RecName: Full=A-conotoxin cyclic Mila; Short=A-CTX-cMila [Conus miliaris]